MVTVVVPIAELLLAIIVSVLVVVAEVGLNDAVTPLGRPDADRLTLLLKPFCGVTMTVLVALVPWAMLTVPGDADRLKSGTGAAFMVRFTLVV